MTVPTRKETPRSRKQDLKIKNQPAKPRDDIRGDFAGDSNVKGHGTKEKSRRLAKEAGKAPII